LPRVGGACEVPGIMPSDIVCVSAFEEPQDLLVALRGSHDEFWNEIPEQWIFRGHADADWELLPTALRMNSKLTHHPERTPGPYATTKDQVGEEADEVRGFADIANRQGLSIPGGWYTALRLLSGIVKPGDTFPPVELVELFALAQHHGVPTRLLDWTRKPLVAAYFAALGAAHMMNEKRLNESRRLAIWALNGTATWGPRGEEAVHIVDPSRYGNLNLVAQDGIFTLHIHPLTPEEPPRCEPLDSAVARIYPGKGATIGEKMRLLTLPAKKARKLLVRLDAEGISASALFPGYDGVVRCLTERLNLSQNWRSPPSED
jgi:hypothetical protein